MTAAARPCSCWLGRPAKPTCPVHAHLAGTRYISVATERAVFRRDDLLAIRATAQRKPYPSTLTVDVVLQAFQARGVSMSLGEAADVAREIVTAANYQPPPM